ncbi:MAG: hypothetical protein JNN20_10770 [Betaproteobacteria bacterium]|nr:hypothetical protein [Betaproteobacteria bacterium]
MTFYYFPKSAFVGVMVGVLISASASASSWDSCADDLDSLRRAARDAGDKANEVKTKSEEFENCKRYPDIYDLLRDRCRSKASDYQSAQRDLQSELETVDRRIRSVRSSCGFDLGSTGATPFSRPAAPNSNNRACDLFKSYKDKLPINTLVEACVKTMPEAECRKCLNSK